MNEPYGLMWEIGRRFARFYWWVEVDGPPPMDGLRARFGRKGSAWTRRGAQLQVDAAIRDLVSLVEA